MLLYKNKYTTFLATGIIIAIIALVHSFSIFATTNRAINDTLMRHSFNPPVSEKLIIIEVEKHYLKQNDDIWLRLLKNLFAQQVKQIVFDFLPPAASADFYKLAAQSKKVIFGQRLLPNTNTIQAILNTLPKQATKTKIDLGLITEKNQEGVYRHQSRIIEIEDIEFASLEFAAAKQLFGTKISPLTSDYQVNFIGGIDRLPTLKLRSALAKNLVKELVMGKTAFVAVTDIEDMPHYFTPIATENGQLSKVLFHAFALDTLLSKRELQPLPEKIIYLLITAITLISLIFYSYIPFRTSVFIASCLSLVILSLCWFFLQRFFLQLPCIELLLTQWLSLWIINHHRLVEKQQLLEQSLFDLSLKLQQKIFSVNFHKTVDPWSPLIEMINQTLNLNRLIFLECPEKGHWLKEVKCFNCCIEDVNEKRRDYHRVPYTTAIEENKPILVEVPYLKANGEDELNYLAPLIFDNQLLGFWAFTIKPENLYFAENFTVVTQMYMSKIAETLYYYQVWQNRKQIQKNRIVNYFQLQVNKNSYEMLDKSMQLLEQRISKLYEVFDSFSYGTALYDLFGRVILVNNLLERLANSAQLPIHQLTLLAFVMQVTGFEAHKAQQILQQVIFSQETFSFPTVYFNKQGSYTLYIKALQLHKGVNSDIKATDTRLILCELIAT